MSKKAEFFLALLKPFQLLIKLIKKCADMHMMMRAICINTYVPSTDERSKPVFTPVEEVTRDCSFLAFVESENIAALPNDTLKDLQDF